MPVGAVGKDLEASVATALLRAGCAAVVAMAYSVYAVAAAEFMAAFYEAVFAGGSVGQIEAGQDRVARFPYKRMIRHSLADWMMCRLTAKATPELEDLRVGAAPWQPKRQPQIFGVAWIPGSARFEPSKRCLLRH